MNTEQKLLILKNLQTAINGQANLWAFGMHLFIKYSQRKTDEDYMELINTIQSQAQDNPQRLRMVLGEQYDFFINYEIKQMAMP
jgi:hypothetical protein